MNLYFSAGTGLRWAGGIVGLLVIIGAISFPIYSTLQQRELEDQQAQERFRAEEERMGEEIHRQKIQAEEQSRKEQQFVAETNRHGEELAAKQVKEEKRRKLRERLAEIDKRIELVTNTISAMRDINDRVSSASRVANISGIPFSIKSAIMAQQAIQQYCSFPAIPPVFSCVLQTRNKAIDYCSALMLVQSMYLENPHYDYAGSQLFPTIRRVGTEYADAWKSCLNSTPRPP